MLYPLVVKHVEKLLYAMSRKASVQKQHSMSLDSNTSRGLGQRQSDELDAKAVAPAATCLAALASCTAL